MELVHRQSLIIWLYSSKNIKPLRKHGFIHYISKRMKYVVMYIDKEEVDEAIEAIKSYHFVRDVELSYRDDIDMTFEHAIEPTEGVVIDDDLLLPEEDGEFFENIAKSLLASKLEEEETKE